MTLQRKKNVLIVRVRAWNKENILPQRIDFVMHLLTKNIHIKFFDIQPERKLGYYLGYLFSFLASYPKMLFTTCDTVLLENPYLVIFAPLFKLRRKKIVAEYVDYYPANLNRLKNERFFRYQVAKIVCRIFHHFVDVVTTESGTGKRTLMRWGVSEKKISILPVGVDTTRMIFSDQQKQELRNKYHIPPNNIVIGYLGKMVKFYFLDNIFHALAQIPREQYKISLLFVGDGPYRTNLEKLSKELHLDVIFAGSIPHDNVFAYYSAMDIFVFPLDSLAIKIGEILSIDGPVLIVRQGMAEDWIQNSVNGVVAKNSSPIELKKAIISTLQLSDKERKKITAEQRKFAIQNLDLKIITKKYLELV